MAKSFGALGAGPGGTTELNLEGQISAPAVVDHNVVLTDLLPEGLSWANPQASGTFTLVQGAGTSTTTTTATVTYLSDYEGTQRNLIRATLSASAFSGSGSWTITPPANFFDLTTPTQLGTYPNTDQIFLYGLAPTQLDPTCTTPTQTGGGTTQAVLESYNPFDLAGDGNIQEDYCQNGATLVVQPSGAAFDLTKSVQGNLDAVPKGALGIGDASGGGTGTGTYFLTWSNVGSDTLGTPVIYDILPYIGDTGVSQGQATVARGSQFVPVFQSVGTLPAGVSVDYSQSTNPCRNEVYPDSANPTCVNDWSPTPPANLADVKALEFLSSGSYLSGSGFSVSLTVGVPAGDVNEVAWNSAATNAADVSDPTNVPLPDEPPKVGLTAPSGTSPVLSSTASSISQSAYSTTPLTDGVTITGTANQSGTLDWSFVGPVAPVGGSCGGLTWTGAPAVASGTVTTPASDGLVTTGPATVQGFGCYSWVDSLALSGGGTATLPAGSPGEVVEATPYTPTLTTTAAVASGAGGTKTVVDHVGVSGSGIGIGNGAPASDTMTWQLLGPVPAVADACTAVDWTGAPVLDQGTLTVTGDGSYVTGTTPLTSLGCYSYTEALPATTAGFGASVAPGVVAETVLLLPPPTVVTSANATVPAFPRTTSTDMITVSGTFGHAGSVAWSLVGPVAPVGGSCAGLTWTGAAVVGSGATGFTGDGAVTSGAARATAPGCYSWEDTATGLNFLGQTVVAAGTPGEVFEVVPYQPTLATTASPAASGAGVNTVSDTVTVSNSDLGTGNGAPASALLTWTLLGPEPPTSPGSCAGVDWTGSPTVATNTTAVVEGTNHTQPVTLTVAGCYTYTNRLAATVDTLGVPTTAPGDPAETFVLITTTGVTTTADQTDVAPRSVVTDSAAITGTLGYHGTLDWSLVGPVAPAGLSCTGLNWAGAPTVASGTTTVTGDGVLDPASSARVGAPGCYSWADTLVGPNYLGPTTVPAGTTGELILVPVLQPTLATTISTQIVSGTESATDAVVVAGTNLGTGNGAPASALVTWTLLGPVSLVAGACTAVDWASAPTAASGTLTVTGNGTYTTPSVPLALASCYSYTETLPATTDSAAATAPAGVAAETAQIPPAPTVTTTTSAAEVYPLTALSDAVVIAGTSGGTGTLTWSLVGPVTPVGGSCTGIVWTGAATADSGTLPVTGDGTLTTGPVTLTDPGCYAWTDTVAGTWPGTTVIGPGTAGETVLVQLHQPTLVTAASVASGTAGTKSIVDAVTVSGSGIGTSPAAPASAALTWTLLGPVTPVAGSCSAVSWTGAATAASGTITVTADGTFATPATALSAVGCYSYTSTLAATAVGQAATSAPGPAAETALVVAPPTVVTAASSTLVYPYSPVTDTVTVTGTGGQAGTVSWSLVGPVSAVPLPESTGSPAGAGGVAPSPGSVCPATGSSWSGAPTVASGTLPVTGDGPVTVGPVTVGGTGCYSWVETFSGPHTLGQTTVAAGAANEVVAVQVFAPTLTTTAAVTPGPDGTQTIVDHVTVTGTGLGKPGNPTTSLPLTWTLLGPAPATDGSCTSVDWTGQPVLATGTLTVTADGTVTTPATTLSAPGCYTFDESLGATAQSAEATTAAGVGAETAYVAPVLAFTGFGALGGWVGAAGLLVVAGAGLLMVGRRRRRTA